MRQHGGPHPLRVSGASRLGRSEPSASDASLSDAASPPWSRPPAGVHRRTPPRHRALRRGLLRRQVEELRDPRLASIPMAVTQKYLIVTANYPARAHGLGKLMSIAEAKRLCPSVELVRGEDLTPYRLHAKRVRAAARALRPVREARPGRVLGRPHRRGRAASKPATTREPSSAACFPPRQTHIAAGINPRRPADVRRVEPPEQNPNAKPNATEVYVPPHRRPRRVVDRAATRLGLLADDLRASARGLRRRRRGARRGARDANLRCSAGIAHNKFRQARVGASQTRRPDERAPERGRGRGGAPGSRRGRSRASGGRRPGVGRLRPETAADLRGIARGDLERRLGARVGARTHDAAWGICRERVEAKGPPQAVTCEDSFVAFRGERLGRRRARRPKAAPDLIARIDEERDDALTENAGG